MCVLRLWCVLLCAACGWWCVCGAGGSGVWVGWCGARGRVRGAGRSGVVGVAGLRRLGYAGLLAGRLVLCVAGLVRRRRRPVRGGDVGVVRGVGVVGVFSMYVPA